MCDFFSGVSSQVTGRVVTEVTDNLADKQVICEEKPDHLALMALTTSLKVLVIFPVAVNELNLPLLCVK